MNLNQLLRGWRPLAIAGMIVVAIAVAITARFTTPRADRPSDVPVTVEAASSPETPADRRIRSAQQSIDREPSKAKGYNQLCAALLQKTRETEDSAFSDRAEVAIKRSLELDPDVKESNFDALKLQTVLMLNQHRFNEALASARRAQGIRPSDHQVYGMLADALVEMGDYAAAVKAADRMAELRPSAAAYARISYLRALHGHTEPAIEAMQLAVRTTDPSDAEGLAWAHVHLGQELMRVGRWQQAEREYDAALRAFPDYHLALEAKGATRAAAGDIAGAIRIYSKVRERKQMPDIIGAIGDLYAGMGKTEEARKQYALVETIERETAESEAQHLALYWANHDLKLDEALAIARRERAARADIFTSDLLAWCLYKKGLLDEARASINEAMRLGTRDARLYYHAGMIHHGLGDREQAVKFLKLALATNAAFDPLQASVARQTLAALSEVK